MFCLFLPGCFRFVVLGASASWSSHKQAEKTRKKGFNSQKVFNFILLRILICSVTDRKNTNSNSSQFISRWTFQFVSAADECSDSFTVNKTTETELCCRCAETSAAQRLQSHVEQKHTNNLTSVCSSQPTKGAETSRAFNKSLLSNVTRPSVQHRAKDESGSLEYVSFYYNTHTAWSKKEVTLIFHL